VLLTPDSLLLAGIRQWHCGARPQLQRRDHAGFSPASLHPFRKYVGGDNRKDGATLSSKDSGYTHSIPSHSPNHAIDQDSDQRPLSRRILDSLY
jgi:hypothetical protein